MRNDAVCGGSAAELIRISRRVQLALVIDSRLDRKFLSRFKLILPLFSHLHDVTGKFVSDDNRVGIDVLGRALMLFSPA